MNDPLIDVPRAILRVLGGLVAALPMAALYLVACVAGCMWAAITSGWKDGQSA